MNLEDFFSIPLEEVSKNGEPKAVSTSCLEVLDEYLSCHQNLDRRISGRLVVE
jgi:5'-nucleotidase